MDRQVLGKLTAVTAGKAGAAVFSVCQPLSWFVKNRRNSIR